MRRSRKARLDKLAAIKAGVTDSKVPDNQAGYPKAVSVALAALAGRW